MYKLLINPLSRQSIPVPFRICINLVQLTESTGPLNILSQNLILRTTTKIGRHIIVVVILDNAGQSVAFLRVSRFILLNNYRSKEMLQIKFVKTK